MPQTLASPRRLCIALTMAVAVLASGGAVRTAALGPGAGPRTPRLIVPSWRTPVGAGAWTPDGSMTTARMSHTATLLKDGRVLVAGGIGGPHATPLTSAEVYDPRTGRWTPTGHMVQPRSGHAAVLLPIGKVLVVGGAGANTATDYPINLSAEIYDPRSGRWSPAHSPIAATTNRYFTATLPPSGKVLVAGGTSDFDVQRRCWRTAASLSPAAPIQAAATPPPAPRSIFLPSTHVYHKFPPRTPPLAVRGRCPLKARDRSVGFYV